MPSHVRINPDGIVGIVGIVGMFNM
jgi:hypothetical protein